MSRSKVVFANSPRGDEYWGDNVTGTSDTQPFVHALYNHGFDVEVCAWYETRDWNDYDHIIIHSPSDIYFHIDQFVSWLHQLENHPSVLNSVSSIRWNLDKRYLLKLQQRGIPIAPTVVVEPGTDSELPSGEFVVKPTTAGGGINSGRFTDTLHNEARELISQIHANNLGAIVQPYLESIDRIGEKALVFYNEKFDHAIQKGALLNQLGVHLPSSTVDAHPNPVIYKPSDAELDLAVRAINSTPRDQPLLYSRVDLTSNSEGYPIVMELEFIDPVLFFEYSEGSLDRYIDAIIERIS
jgi:hypothetical protein